MPYINQGLRNQLNLPINQLAQELSHEVDEEDLDGAVNYSITCLLLMVFGYQGYSEYARALGTLEAVKLELYRRAIAPYEDEKMKQRGDVFRP